MDGEAMEKAIEAARQGIALSTRSGILKIEGHELALGVDAHGNTRVLADVHGLLDGRAAGPRRREGTRQLGELDSFVEYVNRFKGVESIAYASRDTTMVTVVFDDHPAGSAAAGTRWRKDRATYRCPLARKWIDWTARDGQPMTQDEFGDFIEENAEDVIADAGFPPAAALLELARDLRIHSSAKFERKTNPTTGEHSLLATEENATTSTKIPKAFKIAIPVFDNGDHYRLECRVRFQLQQGRPQFAFTIHQRAEALDLAFSAVRKAVADQCGIPVLAGEPG